MNSYKNYLAGIDVNSSIRAILISEMGMCTNFDHSELPGEEDSDGFCDLEFHKNCGVFFVREI